MTLSEIRELYRQKKSSPSEIAEDFVRRIGHTEPQVHAFAPGFDPERVREQARTLEKKGPSADQPLWGLPVLVKDNICVRDTLTTCASKILAGFKPPYDATVVERLKQAGAILLGMANMDEFAFGSSCEHSCYGPTKNPWDLRYVPGGSSGGSAAAVAARMAPAALGSDTGGSIRQPASFCGVVGLKPTYGRVSRYGLIAFASSLDQIGPIAQTVEDAALIAQVIAGRDPRDSTSADVSVPNYVAATQEPEVKGIRLGVPKEYFGDGVDRRVQAAVEKALELFKAAGATVQEVSLPHTEYAVPTYYIVATAEASSNLSRFDGVRFGHRAKNESLLEMYTRTREEGFGPEAKRRITLGTFVLSSGYYDAYYNRALKVRTLIRRDFERVFEQVDCLVTPTAPTLPFQLGAKLENPLQMYLADILTTSLNLAGVPGMSVPCGFADEFPIGIQLIAKPFDEVTLLKVGAAYQQMTNWHLKKPVIVR